MAHGCDCDCDDLRRQIAELQSKLLHTQRLESTGVLAAGLAHDMNNILAAIMNLAEVLLDEPQGERIRVDLEQIIAQSERGAALTRSLLAYSRKGQYRKKVVAMDDAIRSVLPLISHTLPKTVVVATQLDCRGARVDADAIQLGQVLVNLALNAADAMNAHGTLSLSSQVLALDSAAASALSLPAGNYVKLEIADTGCGMDEATRQRVFEPFFTTKPQGTGLGLALVWGVVTAHHGAVAVTSRVGHGSTFSVYLPTTDAEVITAAKRPSATPKTADRTVLVVDDEPAVRAGTTRILERLGHRVLGASDGAEALRVYSAHAAEIDLVVLDMKMPVMGGAECFRRLRKQTNVPVLLATGYAIDEEVQSLVAHGAALIEKPYPAAGLVVEVTRLLSSARS